MCTSHVLSSCPQNNARLGCITELFWEKDRFQNASENAKNSLCMSASWDIVFEFRIVWYPRLYGFFCFFLLSLRKLCSLEESWVGPAFCWIWVSHISGGMHFHGQHMCPSRHMAFGLTDFQGEQRPSVQCPPSGRPGMIVSLYWLEAQGDPVIVKWLDFEGIKSG